VDPKVVLIVGLPATIVLWLATWVRHPEMRGVGARGLRVALVGAIVVALVMVVLTTLFFNGRDFFGGTISLQSASSFGLVVGGAVGAGFFWLNSVILATGLWFKASGGWAVGALAATPVVIAAVGFGFTAFNSYQYEEAQPQEVSGTVALEMNGERLGLVSASGAASCMLQVDGGLMVDASVPATDGRQAVIRISVAATGEVRSVSITVDLSQAFPGKGWEPGPTTTRLVDGWSRAGGRVVLTDLVPLAANGEPDPTERWSGSLSWTCANP
jgi:hypothetical protein